MLSAGDGVGSAEGDAVVAVPGGVAVPAVGSGAGDVQAATSPNVIPNRPTIAPSEAVRRAERGIAPVYHDQHSGLSRTDHRNHAGMPGDPSMGSRLVAPGQATLPKSTSFVSAVPAVRPGAVWSVQ